MAELADAHDSKSCGATHVGSIPTRGKYNREDARMDYFFSILLGVVEGVTEFLPISSTGHLILAGRLLQLPATEFWKSFDIFIQLGAILAVVILYGRRVMCNKKILLKVGAAFIPTAILGFIFYAVIKQYLLGSAQVVLWSLFIVGALMIVLEKRQSKKVGMENGAALSDGGFEGMSFKQSVAIGLFQSFAMIPGVSRSAATIMGGQLLGLSRQTIVEFSFILAIPTMAAATGFDLVKSSFKFSPHEWGLLSAGFVISFITALIVIKAFLRFIQKRDFTWFGIYRIVIALVGFVIV